jgi:hypothetical protein
MAKSSLKLLGNISFPCRCGYAGAISRLYQGARHAKYHVSSTDVLYMEVTPVPESNTLAVSRKSEWCVSVCSLVTVSCASDLTPISDMICAWEVR